jgi:Glycosyltransferase family 87
VIGADRITHGRGLYEGNFPKDNEHGDTYGPVSYLAYVPFEQLFPFTGKWNDLPAAHAAAIAFDVLTMIGLIVLGRRLRAGPAGWGLGITLAYAWAAYPYTLYALDCNTNDSLVAMVCVWALVALRSAPGRGLLVGLGAAAKFAPLALAPLFGARRRPLVFGTALLAVLAITVLPFIPDGDVRELYDRTIGYQAGRPSPFSIWGQADLGALHTAVKVAAIGFALLVAFVPRRPNVRQVAALGGAVLIGLQLPVDHWFYLYVVWFVPFVLVASFGAIAPSPAPAADGLTSLSHPGRPRPAPRSATGRPATSRSGPA